MRFPLNTINIVIISRLAHKKGIDLLVDIIPEVVSRIPNAYFIIRGFGEKYELLEQLRDKYSLQHKIDLGPGIPHDQVRYVLSRGHIFLNTSLSETFCLSMLEAAACGLRVVSTDVGGIPEVLPPGIAYLAKADARCLKE